ncbi:DUF3501 family protein [Lentisalinibacter salinarum]|uniref:DUF3501 family protein n=1 Tax=Lentisalinibacter salinarum TaxID=2992239 RepID=UPI0038705D79
MEKLTADDLMTLERYARERGDFRTKVLEHKKNRQINLGENATLYFEDRLTMQYQVQEMLRIEKIFEPDGIAEELDAYNPLIPDGSNWKATFMVEFPDEQERREQLKLLRGIEDAVWLQVLGQEKIRAISDEDLEREDDSKTSAVHFMRFELSPEMVAALKDGAELAAGIDHDRYKAEVDPVPRATRDSLVADLD